MNILYKILNEALLQWNDSSDIEDTGLIKASDVENRMKTQLVYKIDELKRIRIFYANIEDPDDTRYTYSEYKDKVYVNGEHVKLDGKGYTVNEYEPGEYKVYIEDFDKLEEIEDFTFYECTDLMSIIIPNSITTIGDGAFWGCSGLTSVIIPNSVTLIDNSAFQNCSSLTSIDIPNTVREIYPSAFSDCRGLTSVTIPNSMTWIGSSAFSGCTSLTSVTIPNSVTKMGSCVFYDCINLKTIYVESISKFKKIKFSGWGDKSELLRNVKLIELKKDLNEALLQWNDSDTEDDSHILNHHSIKRSFERIDLNDYKKSVAYWQNENYNYPWFKNYINDIINLYFNNKQDFEKYIKTCINDSNGFDRDKDQAIYYSVTNNYGLFIDKLFKVPDESELKAIVDVTKYVPLKWQSTFWNIAIFGDKGLIWCIVKHNEI